MSSEKEETNTIFIHFCKFLAIFHTFLAIFAIFITISSFFQPLKPIVLKNIKPFQQCSFIFSHFNLFLVIITTNMQAGLCYGPRKCPLDLPRVFCNGNTHKKSIYHIQIFSISKIMRRGIFKFQTGTFRVAQLLNYDNILFCNLDRTFQKQCCVSFSNQVFLDSTIKTQLATRGLTQNFFFKCKNSM